MPHKFKTDKEYFNWCVKLSPLEYQKECDKEYRYTEFVVSEIVDGEIDDSSHYKTKKEAVASALELIQQGGKVKMQKLTSIYKGVDLFLVDREYKKLKLSLLTN
jgi:hypothetical protein